MNDEYILNNKLLFKNILNFSISTEKMKDIKNTILNNDRYLYRTLNGCIKEYFEQSVINIYEFKILQFFEEITKLKTYNDFERRNKNNNYKEHFKQYYRSVVNKKLNITYIIYDLSFKLFSECVTGLETIINNKDNNNDKNNNLFKLFAISYIKIYLYKLVGFIYEKYQSMTDISEIVKTLCGSDKNSMFRRVLKIYVFKVFYHKMNNNWETFNGYDFPNHGIDFIDIVKEGTEENNIDKEIISEKLPPTSKKYDNYPLLKYFIYTEYMSMETFLKEIKSDNYKNEYPLLYKYILERNGEIKQMDFFTNFNDFSNNMIDYYSFNISREDAKKIALEDGEIKKNNEQTFKQKYDAFIFSWNNIKKKCIKYKNHNMVEKQLSEKENLAFFLNDNKEVGFGMYIASAYEYFINCQNEFLQYIIDKGRNKKNIEFYIEELSKKIPIHKANINQIVSFNTCFSNSSFADFNELVNIFTKRNIYEKGTINYKNYNTFIYDYSSIEEELSKLLLAGKCLFEPDNLNFVNYWGEGFNGNSEVLAKFCEKYNQIELTKEEKENISIYLRDQKNVNDFKVFFGGIQLLIFYLTNSATFKNDVAIKDIISSPPSYLRIEEICMNFFNGDKGKKFKVENIMGLFLFMEHYCYDDLSKSLQQAYKQDLTEEQNNKIESKLLREENNGEITLKDLGMAVRRFISRNLFGANNTVDINPKNELLSYLYQPELWEEKISKGGNLKKLISDLLEELKLTVGQSSSFYEKIKRDDDKEINIYKEEEKPEEPNQKIIRQRKRPI